MISNGEQQLNVNLLHLIHYCVYTMLVAVYILFLTLRINIIIVINPPNIGSIIVKKNNNTLSN